MYKIYGDYAYTTETLLEQFETLSEAVRWCEGYTDAGDFSGYTVIEIARFAGDEYEDETVFYEGDDDFALMEEF